ncbi:MAG: ABC transporter ATP-binding protein [Polyangiaceae bacterium]
MSEVVGAQGLSQAFGDVHALKDVSFSVTGPGLVGLLGPNGAGKTSLLDILEGLSASSAGEFRLFGEVFSAGKLPRGYPKARVGVVMQQEARLERIRVGEYAELFAAIQGVKQGAERILERAQLTTRKDQRLVRLSGGEAARLFIATALVHEPELVFLDEPTAALDPESKHRVGDWLLELAAERTILLATHDLREADRLCQQLIFLVGGEIKAWGSRRDLVQNVPARKRRGLEVEDAFFHYCDVTIRAGLAIAPESPGKNLPDADLDGASES